jgi:hypothetical protein
VDESQTIRVSVEEAANTEPRWMRSRWANWLIPVLVGYALPIVITGIGAIYVYIRAVNDQAVAAVLGAITSLLGLGLSLVFYLWFRQKQREDEEQSLVLSVIKESLGDTNVNIARSNEVLDNAIAEAERWEKQEAWLKERLKENPELEQRMEELWEEYEREHHPEG